MSVGRIQTYKYRSSYDDEDGIDGIDSFLRNLPQILFSIIIIIVAYGVLKFFQSPVGSALGDSLGAFVGVLTEMLSQWEFIGVVLVVLWLLKQPGFHTFVATVFGRPAAAVTRRAQAVYEKRIPQDTRSKLERAQNEWATKTKLGKQTLANLIDQIQQEVAEAVLAGEDIDPDDVLRRRLNELGNIPDVDVAFDVAKKYSGILVEAQMNSAAATNNALNDMGSPLQVEKLWTAFKSGAFERHGLQDHQFLQDVPLLDVDKNISKEDFTKLVNETNKKLPAIDSPEWTNLNADAQRTLRNNAFRNTVAEMPNVRRSR